jgi:hypothetical protein
MMKYTVDTFLKFSPDQILLGAKIDEGDLMVRLRNLKTVHRYKWRTTLQPIVVGCHHPCLAREAGRSPGECECDRVGIIAVQDIARQR